jgi:hypothetical protein
MPNIAVEQDNLVRCPAEPLQELEEGAAEAGA